MGKSFLRMEGGPMGKRRSTKEDLEAERVDRELNPEGYRHTFQDCSGCNLSKSLLDFPIGSSKCSQCRKDSSESYRRNHPEKVMWSHAKARAKASGIEFTITPEDLKAIWTDTCPVYLIPLELHFGNKAPQPNSHSLDRIDNSKGYIPGNVAIVSHQLNTDKSNLTPAILRRMLAYMEGRLLF